MNNIDDLFFIHIPKTGGRSIAKVGHTHGLDWGFFYWNKHGIKLWHVPYVMFRYPASPSNCFAVVRNPYDRIVSAYNFKYKGCKSVVHFQQWVNSKLLNLRISLKDIHMNINKYKHNLDVHLLPQYLFTHNESNSSVVNNILKFETLSEDFKTLMKKYNSNIKLNIHIGKSTVLENPCTIEWLSSDNIQLINKLYDKDFSFFGYPKLQI